MLQLLNTKQFIKERFLPKLDALRLPYNVEVVHFATDCESIGQVWGCLLSVCHAQSMACLLHGVFVKGCMSCLDFICLRYGGARHSAESAWVKCTMEPRRVGCTLFADGYHCIVQMVCARAEALDAAGIVLSKHNKGKVAEFFLGSVTNYCTHHAQQPVVVFQ